MAGFYDKTKETGKHKQKRRGSKESLRKEEGKGKDREEWKIPKKKGNIGKVKAR